MYEVGVARSFHAAHQLEESPSAGEHHEHDYRVDAIVRGDVLEANGMLRSVTADSVALLGEARRCSVLRLHRDALTRPVRVSLALRHPHPTTTTQN